MIETEGRVSRVEPGHAWVDVTPVSACGGCSQKSACGTSALASVLGRRRADLMVIDEFGAREGDWVRVGLHEGAMFRTALLVYGLPILGLVAGAVLASTLFSDADMVAAAGALTGATGGWWIARRRAHRLSSDQRYHPRIIRCGGVGGLVQPRWNNDDALS